MQDLDAYTNYIAKMMRHTVSGHSRLAYYFHCNLRIKSYLAPVARITGSTFWNVARLSHLIRTMVTQKTRKTIDLAELA